MYVILTYDVNAKRVSKVMKICRKYLIHAQNSVFEGMLTQSQLQQLKAEIEKRVHPEEDSINIYVLQSTRYVYREKLGRITEHNFIIE